METLPDRFPSGLGLDPRCNVTYPTFSLGKSSKSAASVLSRFIIATVVTVEMVEARSCLVEAFVGSNLVSSSLSWWGKTGPGPCATDSREDPPA